MCYNLFWISILQKVEDHNDMNVKKEKKISPLYVVLLLLFLVSTTYLIIVSRVDANVSVFGMSFSLSMFTGILSSFANMCMIIMVVYTGRTGFITALILVILNFPMNMMGMIMRHDVSTLPGIFNNFLVLVVVILVDRRNRKIAGLQATELDYAKARQKGAERLFEQTATALVNAIDAKDEYSCGHSQRVAEYSEKIAEYLGKNDEECRQIYYAALLHDVGKIGIDDAILNKKGKLTDEEYEAIKQHPAIGKQILSGISEYPYLSIGANNHHERYDGKGYPDKLKGSDIPEISRIIAVADAYDAMSSNRSYRDALPQQIVREEIVKGSGTQFDPEIAKIMQHLIDIDSKYLMKERAEVKELFGKNELICGKYREEVSEGILVAWGITKIRLRSVPTNENADGRSVPAIIMFDSLDGRIHEDEKTIRDLNYFEYGQIRFNGNVVVAGARKSETNIIQKDEADVIGNDPSAGVEYAVDAVRVKDHILVRIDDGSRIINIITALPDSTRYAYIALTGEYCHIQDVSIENLDVPIEENYIPRIAPEVSYIDGPEGDIPNVQIDGYRFAHSDPVPVTDGLVIRFHTMSLPTARLIWHCPFIVLYSSEDGLINGKGYKEHSLVRIDGENWESFEDDVKNELTVEKTDDFVGWDEWKKNNKTGFDSKVVFEKKDNRVIMTTINQGISITNTSYIDPDIKVYAALTGDQVALTEIRIAK